MTLAVRRCVSDDLPRVARIAQRMTLTPGHEPPQGGFLVLGYSEQQYRDRFEAGGLFWVAEKQREIAGLLYAERLELSDDIPMRTAAQRLGIGAAVVIKQVGVLPQWRRSGVGQLLYLTLLGTFPDRSLLVAVVAEPLNVASLSFQEKMGFERRGALHRDDPMPRILLVRQATGSPHIDTRP